MYHEEFILKLYKIDGYNVSIQQRLVVSLYSLSNRRHSIKLLF